ncbi:MAG: potassium-transporting ATPase subunit C [Thermoplasmatales archaeon]
MKNFKDLSTPLRLALITVVMCGLVFPVLMTGIGELAFPYQSQGSQIFYNGSSVGSLLVYQNFSLPVFFHPLNSSVAGGDPDIPFNYALAQIPRVHASTGIPNSTLRMVLEKFKQYTLFFFGSPFVNVVEVNLYLVEKFPSIYDQYIKTK